MIPHEQRPADFSTIAEELCTIRVEMFGNPEVPHADVDDALAMVRNYIVESVFAGKLKKEEIEDIKIGLDGAMLEWSARKSLMGPGGIMEII